jgi:hypothetical protein
MTVVIQAPEEPPTSPRKRPSMERRQPTFVGLHENAKTRKKEPQEQQPPPRPAPPRPLERLKTEARLAIEFSPELERAGAAITRAWRNRKTRRVLAAFPSLKALEKAFMDKAAVNAGAKKNTMYSAAALRARELLKHAPEVVSAITESWDVARRNKHFITRAQFFELYRKLYLYLAAERLASEGAVPRIDATEALSFANEDWRRDVGEGGQYMDRDAFFRCFFQVRGPPHTAPSRATLQRAPRAQSVRRPHAHARIPSCR